MTQEALLKNHAEVSESLKRLTANNLHSFDIEFGNLYDNVISEYTGSNEHSDFYYARELRKRIGNYNDVSAKNKEGEFLEIKGKATYALKDLKLLILKIK